MTVDDVIQLLQLEDRKKEVRFCTINCMDLELLSVYEDGDIVVIDIGSEEDNDERNSCILGK